VPRPGRGSSGDHRGLAHQWGARERSELAFDNQKKKENHTNPGPSSQARLTSSQQSHLAKLRHAEPGVHETWDAPGMGIGGGAGWRNCRLAIRRR
jgi:hypothetical protein